MGATPRTTAAGFPLIVVLALGLGWVGWRVGSRPPARSTAPEALEAELRGLRQAQERTASALDRLEALLTEFRTLPASAPAPREALRSGSPAPETLEALTQALDAVRLTFERESGETQALIRSSPAFGGERLVEVRDRRRSTDWNALEGLERDWRNDPSATDRSQYFQTPRDLLEAYGPPTAIYRPKDGLLFHYRQHPPGIPGPSLYFRLKDGIVIEFFVQDETGEEDEDQ